MKFKVTMSDGKTAKITDSSLCIKGSAEKCQIMDKEKAEVLLHYATHQGWKVEDLETNK